MNLEQMHQTVDACPIEPEDNALNASKQSAVQRKEARKTEKAERKLRKKRLRALRRVPVHRRHLRAAGALLMAGTLGITALCQTLGRLFGWQSRLSEFFGDWIGDAVSAGLGFVLSLVLLYPLWLGMRAYTTAIWENAEWSEGLFGFYTVSRLRRFAMACAVRLVGKVSILVLALTSVLLPGRFLALRLLSAGDMARAAVVSLLTAVIALILPLLWCWIGQGDALALRFYLADESLTLREARYASRLAMRHRGLRRMLLIFRKLPMAAVGLLLFGFGLALISMPDIVWSLALFESHPT